MSGRWKGIILNLMIPGVGFMAQSRWGWGFFYFLIALVVAIPTLLIGYFVVGIVAALHAGVIGDAKHELSQRDIEKIAAASASVAATIQKNESKSRPEITENLKKMNRLQGYRGRDKKE